MNEFVSPNLHVVLIHLPMGLLFTGVLIELFFVLRRRTTELRIAARWMILFGTLGAAAAATSGIYALADVSRRDVSDSAKFGTWKEIAAESPLVRSPAWQHMTRHVWIQSIATGAMLAVVLLWIGSCNPSRNRLYAPLLVITLCAISAMAWGAWEAGEGIYRHGVGVEKLLASDVLPHGAAPTSKPAATQTAIAKSINERLMYMLPPLEAHVIGAGWMMAIAVLSLGLSERNVKHPRTLDDGMHEIAQALATDRGDDAFLADRRSSPAPIEPTFATTFRPAIEQHTWVPAARFWLLSALLTLITAIAGIWFLAGPDGANTLDFKTLSQLIFDPNQTGHFDLNRRSAHVIVGSSILLLSLLMALLSRFAKRGKLVVSIFGLLILLTLATQLWLGVLLMFDTSGGSVTGWN